MRTPPAFSQFFLDRDDEVILVMLLEHLGPAFTVAGTLHRPDGTVDRDFRHEVAPSPPGYRRTYPQTARFPISELRAGIIPQRVLAGLAPDFEFFAQAAHAAELGGDVAAALRAEAVDPGGELLAELASAWLDRKSTRLNSSHLKLSRMPSSA